MDRILYWRIFQRARQKALRYGKWKYLQDEKGEYFFNLLTDPVEKNDLKEKKKLVFEKLKKDFQSWEVSVLTPVPLGK